MAKQPTQARVRRRERKNITNGIAHVNSTFNNTMITISDVQGNTIAWSSAGTLGFKGSRKSTPFAAQMAAEDAGRKAAEHGMKALDVQVRGPALGGNQLCVHFSLLGFLLHPSVMSHLSHITGAGRANAVEFELLIFERKFLTSG